MLQSIKKISNPLTIIALFAGLAEISGTAILPFMKEEIQSLYVWFLIAFPILLILLFFLTLNFNHKVLYAPSDFKNEDNFLKIFGKPTAEERISKLNAEIEIDNSPTNHEKNIEQKTDLKYRDVIRRNSASTHYLAEELVITKLSQEFDEIDKEVMLRSGRSQFLFDAVAKKGKRVFAVEVKYIKDSQSLKNIRSSLVKIQRALQELPSSFGEPMTVILAIATDLAGSEFQDLKLKIDRSFSSFNFPYEVRIFNLSNLEAELLGA